MSSSPSSESIPFICAICGKPIADADSFGIGLVGQRYHFECITRRREEGKPAGTVRRLAYRTVTNGKLQLTATLVCAVFVAGTVWHRVSANAAAVRETIEEVRADQQIIIQHLETLLKK